jgi:hypothetical protein
MSLDDLPSYKLIAQLDTSHLSAGHLDADPAVH